VRKPGGAVDVTMTQKPDARQRRKSRCKNNYIASPTYSKIINYYPEVKHFCLKYEKKSNNYRTNDQNNNLGVIISRRSAEL